jgi:hypothetical protein
MSGVSVVSVDAEDTELGINGSAFLDEAPSRVGADVGVPFEFGLALPLSGVDGYNDPRRGVPFIAYSLEG